MPRLLYRGKRARIRSAHHLIRPLLVLVFVSGIVIAFWPVGQAAYGVWQQRALRAQWDAEAAESSAGRSPSGAGRRNGAGRAGTSVARRSDEGVADMDTVSNSSARATAPASRAPATSGQARATSPAVAHPRSEPSTKTRRTRAQRRPTLDLQPIHSALWGPVRLEIPAIGLDAIVVEGIDPPALSEGPGHDPASAWPGEPGNCVIAGHRNMYGWWFYRLGMLGSGATIKLSTPQRTCVYKVAKTTIVRETDTWVLHSPPAGAAPRLTLYTCALPHSSKRIVVVASLSATRRYSG